MTVTHPSTDCIDIDMPGDLPHTKPKWSAGIGNQSPNPEIIADRVAVKLQYNTNNSTMQISLPDGKP